MKYICADCLKDVPSMDVCPHCGSIRTVLRQVLIDAGLLPSEDDEESDE